MYKKILFILLLQLLFIKFNIIKAQDNCDIYYYNGSFYSDLQHRNKYTNYNSISDIIDNVHNINPINGICMDSTYVVSNDEIWMPNTNLKLIRNNNVTMIRITNNSTLTLKNSLEIDGNGSYYRGSRTAIYISEGSTLLMYDNSLISNFYLNGSASSIINYGDFIMHGGSISSNYVTKDTGAISNYGNFIMYGGNISSNYSNNNAGAILNNGVLSIYDGTIENNSSNNGGAIISNNKLLIYGGNIINNHDKNTSGGIVVSDGELLIDGSPIINNNISEYGFSNISVCNGCKISVTDILYNININDININGNTLPNYTLIIPPTINLSSSVTPIDIELTNVSDNENWDIDLKIASKNNWKLISDNLDDIDYKIFKDNTCTNYYNNNDIVYTFNTNHSIEIYAMPLEIPNNTDVYEDTISFNITFNYKK